MVNNGVLTTTLNIKVNYCSVISGALERGFYNMCTLVIKLVSFYIGNLWYLTLFKGKKPFFYCHFVFCSNDNHESTMHIKSGSILEINKLSIIFMEIPCNYQYDNLSSKTLILTLTSVQMDFQS